MNINNFRFKFITSIEQVSRLDWNSLVDSDYPFIQFEFLLALEISGCVTAETGWKANHLVIYHHQAMVAVMPLYLKTHSYGEYVFDFQWANAYHQSGLNYYPKLLTAIPFTPCMGPRWLINPSYQSFLLPFMLCKVIEEAKKLSAPSWHLLFPQDEQKEINHNKKLLSRSGIQYHWFNHGYKSFGDFLDRCNMKKRKNINRERKQVRDSGIKLTKLEGKCINKQHWQMFCIFYQRTYRKRSGNQGYLNQLFFDSIGQSLASNIMMVVAEKDSQVVAMSLFFKDSKTLYGRYWGASEEYRFLHFEACYYQGIEYCIEQKLQRFDSGAQGEHKISRGFQPIETNSLHWIENTDFKIAIANFLTEEKELVKSTIQDLTKRLPYKENHKL